MIAGSFNLSIEFIMKLWYNLELMLYLVAKSYKEFNFFVDHTENDGLRKEEIGFLIFFIFLMESYLWGLYMRVIGREIGDIWT